MVGRADALLEALGPANAVPCVMEPASTSAAPLTEEETSYYRFNQKVWSIFAPYYDLVTRPLKRLRGRVVELAQTDPTMRVLDVATGTGDQAFAFAEKAAEVV